MKNDMKQKILSEIRKLLKEGFSENVGAGLDNCSYMISGAGGKNYTVLNGSDESITEPEFRRYINDGAPDINANKKICANRSIGIVIVDGSGLDADSLVFVECRENKPVSLKRGHRASTPGDVANSLRLAIEEGWKLTPNQQLASNSETVPGDKPEISPTTKPSPTSAFDGELTKKGNIVCKDKTFIAVYQQWLKYVKKQNIKIDGSYGPLTHAAAESVFGKKSFDEVKNSNICSWIGSQKSAWEKEIKKVAPNVVIGQIEGKAAPVKPEEQPIAKPASEGRFYDNKKLVEAKRLYKKLLRDI